MCLKSKDFMYWEKNSLTKFRETEKYENFNQISIELGTNMVDFLPNAIKIDNENF